MRTIRLALVTFLAAVIGTMVFGCGGGPPDPPTFPSWLVRKGCSGTCVYPKCGALCFGCHIDDQVSAQEVDNVTFKLKALDGTSSPKGPLGEMWRNEHEPPTVCVECMEEDETPGMFIYPFQGIFICKSFRVA